MKNKALIILLIAGVVGIAALLTLTPDSEIQKASQPYNMPQKEAATTTAPATSSKPAATTTKADIKKPSPELPKPVSVTNTAITTENTLNLINNERIAHGIAPLKISPALMIAARMKLNYMVDNEDFSHDLVCDQYNICRMNMAYINSIGYQYKEAGENLAQGNWTVEQMVNTWIASPKHETNILNADFTETGIAFGPGTYQGKAVIYAVQYFGWPLGTN